jgi:hypothetical protein
MYSFLVLGLIPGTDIQISFAGWLLAASLVLAAFIKLFWKPGSTKASTQTSDASLRKLDAKLEA